MFESVISQFEQYVKLNKKIQPETLGSVMKITDPSILADTIAAHMQIDIASSRKYWKSPMFPSAWSRCLR